MKKGAALLMGLLIVSVIMVIAVTVASNTLKTLISGTNIADSEIAAQGAESGLENALVWLGTFTDGELFAGYRGSDPITRPLSPAGDEPTGETPWFLRRDMTEYFESGGGWPVEEDISSSGLPNHQYWNFKIWRNPGGIGGLEQAILAIGPLNSSNITLTNKISKTDTDNAPAYPNNDDSIFEGNYSVRLGLTPSFSGAGFDSQVPNNVSLKYWVWADNRSSICEGNDVATGDPIPIICGSSPEVPISNGRIAEGTEQTRWANFSTSGLNIKFFADAGYSGVYYSPYLHLFYYLKFDRAYISTGSRQFNTSTNLYVARNNYYYPGTDYIIDTVGMFGNERIKLRAIFDPLEKKFWRVNFY